MKPTTKSVSLNVKLVVSTRIAGFALDVQLSQEIIVVPGPVPRSHTLFETVSYP